MVKVISILDLHHLRMCKDLVGKVSKWELTTLDEPGQFPTELFCHERPVDPYRAKQKDTIDKVKQRMDCQWASRESVQVILIIYPRTPESGSPLRWV